MKPMKPCVRHLRSLIPNVLLIVVLLAAAVALPSQMAEAQSGPYARVAALRAPVYAGPGFGFWQLGALRQDVITPLTGISADGQWFQSSTPIGQGWLWEGDVEATGVETLAVADPGPTATITTGAANVRRGPGIGAEILDILFEGTQVYVIGRQPDGTWLQIRYAGGRGWINASLTDLGVLAPPTDPAQPTEPTDPTTPADPAAPADDPVVEVPVTTEGPLAFPTTQVNLRSGPGTQYSRLGTLIPYVAVPIIGRTQDGTWLLVDTEFGVGWVSLDFVVTRDYFGSAPIVGVDDASVEPELAATTRTTVNLRSGPGIGFESLAVLRGGTDLVIRGQSPDLAWWFVDSPDGEGWINKTVVRTAGDFSNAPIVTPE